MERKWIKFSILAVSLITFYMFLPTVISEWLWGNDLDINLSFLEKAVYMLYDVSWINNNSSFEVNDSVVYCELHGLGEFLLLSFKFLPYIYNLVIFGIIFLDVKQDIVDIKSKSPIKIKYYHKIFWIIYSLTILNGIIFCIVTPFVLSDYYEDFFPIL